MRRVALLAFVLATPAFVASLSPARGQQADDDKARENWKQIQAEIEKANAALDSGKHEQVFAAIQKILTLCEQPTGQPPEVVKHLRATCYMARSKTCAILKRIPAALDNFEKYCDLEPDFELIEQDKGFDNIRRTPRFKDAVAKAKKASRASAAKPAAPDAKLQAAIEQIRDHANKLDSAYAESRFDDVVTEANALFALCDTPGLAPDNVRGLRSVLYKALAGSYAATGKTDEALEAFEKAVGLGFRQWEAIEQDKNFDSIRKDERFQQIIARTKSGTPQPANDAARAQENLKALKEHIAKVDPAMNAAKFDEALKEEQECLELLDQPTGLPPPTVQNLQGLGHMIEACCYGMLGKIPEALDHFEQSLALGFRQWAAIEQDKRLDPIRDEPRFKQAIANVQKAFTPGDERLLERIDEELTVGPLGGATVKLKMSMEEREFARFKTRMSPLVGLKDEGGMIKVPVLGEPLAKAVLRSLDVATMPVELRNLDGAFDEAGHSFACHYTLLGTAKNRGGRWRLPLPDSEEWKLEGVTGEVATLTASEQRLDHRTERRTRITLPKGATGVELEKQPWRLSYRLPPYAPPASTAAGQPELRFEARPHILSALYKLYGDPRFAKFWAAKTVFRNTGKETLTNYRVRFRVDDYSSWSPWETCETVYPGQTVVDAYYPILDHKIRDLKAASPAILEVEWEYERPGKQKVSSSDSARIRLLGMNEAVSSTLPFTPGVTTWHDARIDTPEIAASFTSGDDPVIQEVLGLIQHATGGVPSVYTDPEAKKFLEALYDLLRVNVAYEGPRGLEEDGEHGQEYKYGRDVLRTKTATCVNLAIFYASVCEAAGLEPHLYFVQGHCFPGVRLPDSGEMLFVETTCCGGGTWESSESFDAACRAAHATYDVTLEQGFIIDVNVKKLRSRGVTPPELPDPGRSFIKEYEIKSPPTEEEKKAAAEKAIAAREAAEKAAAEKAAAEKEKPPEPEKKPDGE